MGNEKAEVWQKAAQTIVSAGMIPIVIGNTIIELLQEIMSEDQAQFITNFDKPSLTLEQLQERTGWDKSALNEVLEQLMYNGVIVSSESRTSGVTVYRLLGPYPGLFEYTNLRGETSDKHKRLARKFETLMDEMRDFTQENYDLYVTEAKKMPPVTRVVPVEEQIAVESGDKVMPLEEVSKIIDKYDDIAVAHCYCRHSKDLLDDPCRVTDEKLNCFLLGKSAKFAAKYEFGKTISKAEAQKILVKSSEEGLVHKAFHIHLNKDLDEEAICNCCKCCCGPFQMYYRGVAPYHCYASFIARVDFDKCTACENCIEICPMETIEMVDDCARVIEERCIGCGVCVHHCGDGAMILDRTEMRQVFVPPKRIVS